MTHDRVTQDLLVVLGEVNTDPWQVRRPVVEVDDAGVTRGDGCFEGLRLCTGTDGTSRVDELEAHLTRFARSAAALDIAYDEPAWRALVALAATTWVVAGEAAMRLVLTRGAGRPAGWCRVTGLDAALLRHRRDGVRAVTLTRGVGSDAFVDAPWLLGGVKTLSYAVNMAAHREANRRGADEVIFVSGDGMVLEAPTGSVVWAEGSSLCTTPRGATGILAGTTQARLFRTASAAGWATHDRLVDIAHVRAADAVWVVSAVRGPVDVTSLDGIDLKRRAELSAQIRELSGF